MKQDSGKIRYGIYIDRKHAHIFAMGGKQPDQVLTAETVDNPGLLPRTTNVDREQESLQNEKNEQLRKFCKLIIERIGNACEILVFGPSVSKFELQKEIIEAKRFKLVDETLEKSDVMTREEAQRFVRDYYCL